MFGKRLSRALAVTTVASLVMAAAAFASEVNVAVVDVTVPANSVTLAPGGSGSININMSVTGNQVGTATFEVYRDWTLSGGTFSGSNPQEFTVAPRAGGDPATTFSTTGSVSIAAGQGAGTFTLAAGAFDITNSNATGAKLNAGASSNYQVTVLAPPANTSPQVSVTGPANGATYEFGSVPAAGCSVVDAEDIGESAVPQISAITGTLATYGLGSQTVTCSYTDGGGLSDSDSVMYTIVDTGKPVITDLGPTATPDGSNDWYISAVTNTFEASDSGAGFASETNPYQFTESSGTAEGSAVKINSGTVTDVAGNTADAIDSAAFMIDLSDPTNVSFIGGPAAGSSYFFGSVPAAPTCDAEDAISQLDSCVVTGYSSAVGSHTMTATATDNAGRTATATRSYTVLAWELKGFYSPVDMDDALNIVKAGSTVPLKFEIFAGSTEFTTTDKIASFKVGKVPCGALDTTLTDDIELYSTGQTVLRYDSTGGQFIQNWQVPKTSATAPAGSCYTATMTTLDGSSLTAYFKTK